MHGQNKNFMLLCINQLVRELIDNITRLHCSSTRKPIYILGY